MDEKTTAELQKQRDEQDSTRKAAPLQIPQDALVVDTSELNLEQVVAKILEHLTLKKIS